MPKLSPNVVVSVSKFNGNGVSLFNVRRPVDKWIEIDIHPARVVEKTGCQVVLPEVTSLMTLRMTKEQLIAMLANTGEYSGAPATLVRMEGREIAPVEPEVSKFEQAVMDFKRKTADMSTSANNDREAFIKFVDGLNISKTRKDKSLELVNDVLGNLNKYGRDVLETLVESVEKIRETSGLEK